MHLDLSILFPRRLFSAETVNGRLSVYKEGKRLRVVVGGVTQSLSDTDLIHKRGYWQGYLNLHFIPEKALVLGYGAGTADALLREKYPGIDVTGVETDSVIANQAKALLFPQLHSPVYIQSAQQFLNESTALFDLIICDIFTADKVDECVFDASFWLSIREHMTKNGIAVVNRILSYDTPVEYRSFEDLLQTNFEIIDILKINTPSRRYNCLFYLKLKPAEKEKDNAH